ncbi:two-component system response regulator [Dehalococcoides mccartyi]|jgi:DNA-binding NarL/FixJ family response regulator|uniref:response regulator n=1 Tax=Dehalococcoides mccartyi TaxID=61435 RepID=UPI00059D53F4|nr:response regulator transcription factor [Dehalococcoides mccartyi]APH13083.1 two-component system response regulator [Dehalococcoides mccartyi]APH13104.1 two-component system response regulator [Dehalococcoides mccartyi]
MNYQNPEIRIFVVDDHEVVRHGLKTMLETVPDFIVVGESDGSEAVVEKICQSKADILLLDIRIEGSDGFQIASQVKARLPALKIILISGYDSNLYITESLRHKIRGFIPKGCQKEYIFTAIRMVALGATVWHGDQIFQAIRNLNSDENQITVSEVSVTNALLDPRELQILTLVSAGKTNKAISAELDISIDMVKKTVSRLMHKFNSTNRTQLATAGSKLKLV